MTGSPPQKTSTPFGTSLALAVATVWAAVAIADANTSLAGNWVLDESRSQVERGRAGGPGPQALVIEVDGDDEVIIYSDTGMNRAVETYRFAPGDAEHDIPGPLSWDTMATSSWEDGMFVVNITRSIVAPNGQPFNIKMMDVYSVSDNVLTLVRTQGPRSWTSVFDRASPGDGP